MENAYGYSLLEGTIELLKKTKQDMDQKTGLFLNKDFSGNECFYLIYQVCLWSVPIFLPQKNTHKLTFMKNAEYPIILKIVGSFSDFLNLI